MAILQSAEQEMGKSWPSGPTPGVETVSVVVPCYNEESFIAKALEKLAGQYDREHYEIIIVDGLSDDRTREVINEFKRIHSDLSIILIDNPARNIPTALNLGIKAAQGNIIARMDAHAVPSAGYIQRCVEVLSKDDVGVVGMPCRVQPGAPTVVAHAIASAVSHPFGIGDAKYRLREGGPLQEPVDTVAFACFRKSLWKKLGGFNEALHTNEDYDFNYRARQAGSQVMLDRSGHCDYFARTSLATLGNQYARYGGWKAQMIRLHPRSIKLRHLVAPLFVLSIFLLGFLGLIWSPAWLLLGTGMALYFFLAFVFGFQAARHKPGSLPVWLLMPWIFLTIHLAWGTSFLVGLLRRPS